MNCSIAAVVRVGYEKTTYTIAEEKGFVEVCVDITSDGIEETFSLNIVPDDTTLGEYS